MRRVRVADSDNRFAAVNERSIRNSNVNTCRVRHNSVKIVNMAIINMPLLN